MNETPPADSEPPADLEPRGEPELTGHPEPGAPQHRLDPDRVVAQAGGALAEPLPPPEIDTRRYRWMIGIFGLVLVIAASVYEFAQHGVGSPGIAAGKRLHYFVAPLATSGLDNDANTNPRCDPAHPNPLGLNVCGRTPLVIAFFVTGSGSCRRQVDTLQAISHEFAPSRVQFAAIAIRAGRAEAAALVRAHHWTIPVAYDRDGAIGDLYSVEICPMVELAYRGGIVANRLIGEHWLGGDALAAQVRALVGR